MIMTLDQLKDLILTACDKGFGDTSVDVVQINSCVDDGCPIVGLRCVTEFADGKETKYVSIIEA